MNAVHFKRIFIRVVAIAVLVIIPFQSIHAEEAEDILTGKDWLIWYADRDQDPIKRHLAKYFAIGVVHLSIVSGTACLKSITYQEITDIIYAHLILDADLRNQKAAYAINSIAGVMLPCEK